MTALNGLGHVLEVAVMGAVDIRVSVLGPLRVHAGGVPVTVPGPRCSVVLAALALSTGRTVTAQTLIDDVWNEELPRSATASLHSLVARLRRVLGADAIRTVRDRASRGRRTCC
jgi:DNA-binding SARP family transcriptional activator